MGVCRALLVALALLGVTACESEAALKAHVRYAKSGGFAGVVQKLTIRPDGSGVAYRHEQRRDFRLSSSTRRSLERAVRSANLAHTKDPKPGDGADAFEYSVSYGPHKVVWSDLSDDPPARVERLYDMLDELYERYAPSS
jgi:hypothetical protein